MGCRFNRNYGKATFLSTRICPQTSIAKNRISWKFASSSTDTFVVVLTTLLLAPLAFKMESRLSRTKAKALLMLFRVETDRGIEVGKSANAIAKPLVVHRLHTPIYRYESEPTICLPNFLCHHYGKPGAGLRWLRTCPASAGSSERDPDRGQAFRTT